MCTEYDQDALRLSDICEYCGKMNFKCECKEEDFKEEKDSNDKNRDDDVFKVVTT